MAKFKATVRFIDLVGPDSLAVRKALDEQLRIAGVGRWRVVDINEERSTQPVSDSRIMGRWRMDRELAGKLFLLGAALWGLWFFWVLLG